MRTLWPAVLGLGFVIACHGDRPESAASGQAQDTVAVAATLPGSASTKRTAGEPVVEVREEAPGMIVEAHYQPLDAQHIAQAKYPTGKVEAGFIERRGGSVVYRFRIKDDSGVRHDVLVDAYDGRIVGTLQVLQ